MRMLIVFIWVCCIAVINGRALTLAERKKIDGNDNYSEYNKQLNNLRISS